MNPLLDEFAIRAMVALLNAPDASPGGESIPVAANRDGGWNKKACRPSGNDGPVSYAEFLASASYDVAAAMMAERCRRKKESADEA